MNTQALEETAHSLFANANGLLAMDESIPTCNRRFAALGIPQTEELRRAWRELLLTTPNLNQSISGAILCDETLRQKTWTNTPFTQVLLNAGILPGIKVDRSTVPLPNFEPESITEGLDGLAPRLHEYAALGARFAKWRAVLLISAQTPSPAAIDANAHALARYAALCQSADLVPIVEPEVLMTGPHDLVRCAQVTEQVLAALFHHLRVQRVLLEALILKPNMVLPGTTCPTSYTLEQVADATVHTLLRTVPAAVPAIAFLSGGQPPSLAAAHLNAMNLRFHAQLPWPLSFSFARAIQQPALDLWRGDPANVPNAQRLISHRVECCRAARQGLYDPDTDLPLTTTILEPTHV